MFLQPQSPSSGGRLWPRRLMGFLSIVVTAYLVWLGTVTALRVVFPWDLFVWPESPFMTNLLKLDQGRPLFSLPADANSFVYSPGLEYLTFALLRPLSLHLDIRFCRAVNVSFGVLAGVIAGLYFRRVLRTLTPGFRAGRFAVLGGAVAVLVVFRNFTADIPHPDNLVMLHTAGLFLLTLCAVEGRSFGLGLVTMAFAGLGVFAKQTLVVSFAGPALVFVMLGVWGWRRCVLLAGVGALASLAALAWLWHQPFARFYTMDVLSRQGLNLTHFYWMVTESLHADRALLWVMGLGAVSLMWRAGATGMKYLQIWVALGACSVWPNALSYLKQMGAWNNLVIFQLWLLFLVWPALGLWLAGVVPVQDAEATMATGKTGGGGAVGEAGTSGAGVTVPSACDISQDDPVPPAAAKLASPDAGFNFFVGALLVVFVLTLLPTRLPPPASMYACCAAVQERVGADLRAGRKVLVAHGAMYQIRAGARDIPLDRANSVLELKMAGLASLAQTAKRIREHYYDRIYLTEESWYDPAVIKEIEEQYVVEAVIQKPPVPDRIELGRDLSLSGDCKILSPRAAATQQGN